MNIKVVEFCTFPNIYNDKLCDELKKEEEFRKKYEIYKIVLSEERKDYEEKVSHKKYVNMSPFGKMIYWSKFQTYIQQKYKFDKNNDIVNVQYVDFYMLVFYRYFKNNFKKVVLTFWGSDLLRQKENKLKLLFLLFKLANNITFETEDMKDRFVALFHGRFIDKLCLLRFGLSSLDNIDKCSDEDVLKFSNKYGLDTKKHIVVVGYNRSKQQQHLGVIKSIIGKVNSTSIQYVLPWNYGEEDGFYEQEIRELLDGKCDYLFIKERLEDIEVAALRKTTDVLIQVQTTDSLSASMLETLYAGNQVITGSWLPYANIQSMGITMTLIDNVNQCDFALEGCIKQPLSVQEVNVNRQCIYKLSSWSVNLKFWLDIYRT